MINCTNSVLFAYIYLPLRSINRLQSTIMQLFYAPDITLPEYTLEPEESKHCVRVLRLGEGDEVDITDGRGNLHHCRITDADARRCRVRVENTEFNFEPLPYRLVMAVAPTKNADRFEWFVEKAAEIGVSEIIPLECERSERRRLNTERTNKVLVSAMKQSLKATLPLLHEPTPFAEAMRMPFAGRKYIAHCDKSLGERRYLPSEIIPGGEAMIFIGPEGDFSPAETALAAECGCTPISLGPQRLRTETAAVVAVAMVAAANYK